jgi:predicted DNA-binding ArsR family transcriptional regulator
LKKVVSLLHKQRGNPLTQKEMTQSNFYKVVYSDGVRVLDTIEASNLAEAKQKAAANAKTKNYGTAYYKVSRCYSGGVMGSSGKQHWH